MDSGASLPLIPVVHPTESKSSDLPSSNDAIETQQDGEVGDAAGVAENFSTYTFPRRRLKQGRSDPSREPLVLVACGSFSPITLLHLRMFEMAYDYIKVHTNFEVIGSYLSPVGDTYKKLGLASAQNRMHMCELAIRSPSSSIDLDKWEALQEDYQPTALVLDHFSEELNSSSGSHGTESIDRQPVRIALLAGADLLQSMNIPGVWSDESLSHIMSHYPLFIVERFGTDVESAKAPLERWKGNIHVIPQPISNEISSTKIRQLRRQGMSIRYLVPDEVCGFIEERGLYTGEDNGTGR